MKIAFDVDVLAKQMSINDYVHKVADWGYKYIEQSPHPRINPFYKHPLFSEECEAEYRKALKETGVEISSFIVVYRWSGPTEEQRQHAVANWKRIIQIAVNMGVPVINTEFSGDPNQQEICNGMFFRSMEELLPIIEREGLRVEIQSHPYDFCELNDETCDIVKSFRSKNLGYVYSASHGFFYDQGKGDVRHMLRYAGDELTHVLLADTWNQTKDCRYILNPPWLNAHGRADVSIHQHTAMGEGEVDFDGIFETLRDMDFANKQLKPNAPKVGGDNIICVSYFGFPEKMDRKLWNASNANSCNIFLRLLPPIFSPCISFFSIYSPLFVMIYPNGTTIGGFFYQNIILLKTTLICFTRLLQDISLGLLHTARPRFWTEKIYNRLQTSLALVLAARYFFHAWRLPLPL